MRSSEARASVSFFMDGLFLSDVSEGARMRIHGPYVNDVLSAERFGLRQVCCRRSRPSSTSTPVAPERGIPRRVDEGMDEVSEILSPSPSRPPAWNLKRAQNRLADTSPLRHLKDPRPNLCLARPSQYGACDLPVLPGSSGSISAATILQQVHHFFRLGPSSTRHLAGLCPPFFANRQAVRRSR